MSEENQTAGNMVYQFDRTETEVIRATLSEFNGALRADLRIFYQDAEGEWRPTKKGINVPVELLPELKQAVEKLQSESEAKS